MGISRILASPREMKTVVKANQWVIEENIMHLGELWKLQDDLLFDYVKK